MFEIFKKKQKNKKQKNKKTKTQKDKKYKKQKTKNKKKQKTTGEPSGMSGTSGCPGNLGGTLGSTFPYHFLRDVRGTFGDVRDISVRGTAGGARQAPPPR